MTDRTFVSFAVVVAVGCGTSSTSPLPPPPEGKGFQVSVRARASAGTEIWKCFVYDLPTTKWAAVNRVESIQSSAMHHMNISALTSVVLEPGEYDCTSLYEQHPELMDALMFYASATETQTVQLPQGTAAELPPRLRVLHELHYVNTNEESEDVFSYVNAYTLDPSDIVESIWGGPVRDLNINIPPHSKHDEWTRCVMNEDVDILFVGSHMHRLGSSFSVRLFDGASVGEQVYLNTDWHAPQLKSFTDRPLRIHAGTGFEFNCHYENPFAHPVTYGQTAADEMCTLALVFTPGDARRKCIPVASSDGVL